MMKEVVTTSEPEAHATGLLTFIAVVVVGGANFVAVRVSNQELAPFWGAGLRFSIAAALFVAIALVLRITWPRDRRQLALIALYGLFSFTISYALMYWALVGVNAAMAAILLAVVPLVTPLLAAAHRMEKLRLRNMAGAVIALVGITIMTVGPAGLLVPLSGLAAIAIAALALSESVIIAKLVSVNHPVMTNAVGMPIGAVGLLILSLLVGDEWVLPQQSDVVGAVIYLSIVGSVGLFILMLMVIRKWTSSAVSYAFVLFPVTTLLIEAWLLDEPLALQSIAGAVIIMAGVWFGALAPSARTAGVIDPTDPREDARSPSDLETSHRLQRRVLPATQSPPEVLVDQSGGGDGTDGDHHQHRGQGVE
jgi:drug/metabolite transporter (DMT)-like permease